LSHTQLLVEGVPSSDTHSVAWRRVFAGGLAGACASSATYPLDLIRTRLTLQVRAPPPQTRLCVQPVCVALAAGFSCALTAFAVAQGAHEHKYRGIAHALTSIVRAEGFFALYKGIGTTLVVRPRVSAYGPRPNPKCRASFRTTR
jgi:hypothetical protein